MEGRERSNSFEDKIYDSAASFLISLPGRISRARGVVKHYLTTPIDRLYDDWCKKQDAKEQVSDKYSHWEDE